MQSLQSHTSMKESFLHIPRSEGKIDDPKAPVPDKTVRIPLCSFTPRPAHTLFSPRMLSAASSSSWERPTLQDSARTARVSTRSMCSALPRSARPIQGRNYAQRYRLSEQEQDRQGVLSRLPTALCPKREFLARSMCPRDMTLGALEGVLRGDRNCHRFHQAVQVVDVEVLRNATLKRAYEDFKARATSPESRLSEVPMVSCVCLRSRPVVMWRCTPPSPLLSAPPGLVAISCKGIRLKSAVC